MFKISRILPIIILVLAASCSKGGNKSSKAIPDSQILVRVDSSFLTVDQLQAALPPTAKGEDSVRMAKAYIRSWIDNQIIPTSTDGVDMEEIEKMVSEYRNQLILWQYRQQMLENKDFSLNQDSVKAFYNTHLEDFKLSRPLIQGTYLKIQDGSKDLPKIRKLYRSTATSDLDQLEKFAINSATHFDYFGDKWIDWEQIETRIPYDFGPNIDNYLRTHKNLDVSVGGFTYLLYIKDVLHTGQTMPFETAKPLVENRLTTLKRSEYDQEIRKQLYDKAISQGRITINCDFSR